MKKRLWGLFPLTLLATATAAHAGDIKLRLLYDNEMTMNDHQFPANGEIDFVIKKHDVQVYSNIFGHTKLVGSKSHPYGDMFGPVRFNVKASEHSLEFTGVYRSHVERAVVTTDGVSSCSATINVALKPGFSEYEYRLGDVPVRVSDMKIGNVRCELSTS